MHQNADKLSSRVRKRIKKICTLQVALTSDDCVSKRNICIFRQGPNFKALYKQKTS